MIFSKKTILVTGGTGSFGKNFIKYLLKNYNCKKIIIFSRDEFKQYEMQKELPKDKYKSLRYFLGDVRDGKRLKLALRDVDFVVHAAALKQVDTAEYNPFEFICTNIMGAQNVIEAAIFNNVQKVIALSTDKACSPINLYGATKLCSDKLFVSSNNLVPSKLNTKFSVVRYGNVFESRGSVIPFFKELNNKQKAFPLTHREMTRFNISMDDAIKTVDWAFKNSKGSEIIVPKLKSFKIHDLILAINKKAKIKIIGTRPGEKIHEELISLSDNRTTILYKKYFLILPSESFFKKYKFHNRLKKDFCYRSDLNEQKMSPKDIKQIL